MSIRIEIGERYVVTSDSFQFILHEKKRAESGKNSRSGMAVGGWLLPEIKPARFRPDASRYSDRKRKVFC